MITFWISAAAMGLMVALVLVQALRRGAESEGAADVAIYRDQLAEIARDQARGILAEEEAGRMRIEVSRRLLEADQRGELATVGTGGWGPVAVVVAALVLALGIYRGIGPWEGIGAPGYDDLPLVARLAASEAAYAGRPSQTEAEAARGPWVAPEGSDPASLDLLTKLRAAVAGRPDDLQGQELLVENEAAFGNFVGARQAQEAVVRLKGAAAGAEDWLKAAELAIYAAGGQITPEAEAALGEVLTRDPANGAARFWIGLMAAQVDRPDRAFQMWEPLVTEGPPDAPWIAPIRERIEAIAAAAGVPYSLPQGGPSASDMAAAAEMSGEDRQAMIETMVAGLEGRLLSEGGPLEDWVKLLNALKVLGAADRQKAVYDAARAAFAADPAALKTLNEVAP